MKAAQAGAQAWAVLLSVLILMPAVQVVLGSRDVDALDFTSQVATGSWVAWAGRGAVLLVAICAAITLLGSVDGLKQPSRSRRGAMALRLAILGFIVGYTVLPALLGESFPTGLSGFYGSALLVVAYRAGRLTSTQPLNAVRWGLLILLVGGLLSMIVAPSLSMQVQGAQLRLPIIDFRFWGLGSNPNNLAPLSLCLMFLLIYQPFGVLGVNLLAWACAAISLVLAQSQTTWMAALMILPFFALYRSMPKPVRKARIDPIILIATIVLTAAGFLMLLWELAQLDYSLLFQTAHQLSAGTAGSVGSADAADSLMNRVEIWQVALDTWRDHFWFGYGPTVWDVSFRLDVDMPYAYNAHNQFMQTVSSGGLVALVALLAYLGTLFSLCIRTAAQSNGLTMALFALMMVRSFTEAPFETNVLLNGELLMHLLLVYLLAVFLWRDSAVAESKGKRRRRRSGLSIFS